MVIDEWYVWAEGPPQMSDSAAETLRELMAVAVDAFCRRLETDLGVLRGAADIDIRAMRATSLS